MVVSGASCSTTKNTAGSRMWHSFTARYNTYFNGHEAYKQGMLAKENGHKDNYADFLPFYMVGNEQSRTLGSSNFETAITKCKKAIQQHSISKRPKVAADKSRSDKMKAYLAQKEFNPFLRHAWMLMGETYFQRGHFLEAASVFSYITRHYATQPIIANEARAYLVRCYSELEWYYDAEDVVTRLQRDTITHKVRNLVDATMANLLLKQEKYEQALPYLEKAAKKASTSYRQARLYFLMGQLYQHLGQNEKAYEAYDDCLSKNPKYQLAFHARIRQTEVMGVGKNSQKMLRRLERMASDEKNKDYLDQVYYAMGNIYMARKDTLQALGVYEKGRANATQNGPSKAQLVLCMAGLYWERGDYVNARECYRDAVGAINSEHQQYDEVKRRSKALDDLVPHTSVIELQDSLLALSVMSEEERNAAIDRVIEALKQKEKEAEQLAKDSAAQKRMMEKGLAPSQRQQGGNNTTGGADKSWYFYNPTAVEQGKQNFRQLWGNRKLEDDWRRSNRTVIEFGSDEPLSEDSLSTDSVAMDSLPADTVLAPTTAETDPHGREYYLAQIPFSGGQKVAAHQKLQTALYEAALIEKDKLEDFPLAIKTFNRLMRDYPWHERMPDVYYQLYLTYSRLGNTAQANHYRTSLVAQFPDNVMAKLLADPEYEYRARHAKQLEDSLYRATYEAYRERQNQQVAHNAARSAEFYPLGANRPKFIFVDVLSRLATSPIDSLINDLRKLVADYPKSDVSPLAGMMVKGLESGLTLGSTSLDIGALWDLRTAKADATSGEVGSEPEFDANPQQPFYFLVAYLTDSLNDNQLLYDFAHFNFTTYLSSPLQLRIQRGKAITQFVVSGFADFASVHAYAQRVATSSTLKAHLAATRTLLIAESNVELLGASLSYEDYADFYEQNFAPAQLLNPTQQDADGFPLQRYEDELTPEELQEQVAPKEQAEETDDAGEWY